MRISALVFLCGALALPALADVRAVLPLCCTPAQNFSIIDPATGAIERTLSTGSVAGTGYLSPAGDSLVLMKGGEDVAILSSTSVYALTTVNLKTGVISGPVSLTPSLAYGFPLAVNPGSGVLYYVYDDPSLNMHLQEIDPANLTVLRDVTIGPYAFSGTGMVVSPDGQRIYITVPAGLSALDAGTLQVNGTVTLPLPAYYMALSPDGSTLYVSGGRTGPGVNGTIDFVDTATLAVTQTYNMPVAPGPLGVSPDGSQLYFPGATGLDILQVSTLMLSNVPAPVLFPAELVVAPYGYVYLGDTAVPGLGSPIHPVIYVFDPVSQMVVSTLDVLNPGYFVLSADGSRMIYLYQSSSNMSLSEAVPSQSVVRTVPSAQYAVDGAYDAKDNLVFLQYRDTIDTFDGDTLAFRGRLDIRSLNAFVIAGDTAYAAISGLQILRFDPLSLQVTGVIDSTCTFERSPSVIQLVMNGDYLYAPYEVPRFAAESDSVGESPNATTCPDSGIAVFNIQEMKIVTAWPLLTAVQLFIAPGADVGYIVGYGAGVEEVARISLKTGKILKQLEFRVAASGAEALISPDGSTIYLGLEGSLYVIDTASLAITQTVPGWNLFNLSLTPDGQYIYGVASPCTNCATMYEIVSTASFQVVGTIQNSGGQGGPAIFVGH